jgi:hypothetical protein
MPATTDKVIDAYASCRDGRCAGYKQQPVKAVETLIEFSYVDLGGDIPGIERSTTLIRFADETDEPCPYCGEPRLVADQVRPIYPNISGIPQDALLAIGRDSERVRDLMLESAKRDTEIAELRAQVAALVGELASRPRGPGRPRKEE